MAPLDGRNHGEVRAACSIGGKHGRHGNARTRTAPAHGSKARFRWRLCTQVHTSPSFPAAARQWRHGMRRDARNISAHHPTLLKHHTPPSHVETDDHPTSALDLAWLSARSPRRLMARRDPKITGSRSTIDRPGNLHPWTDCCKL